MKNVDLEASGGTKMPRRVWALAWPMMLSNLSVPFLGLVDTLVMGHLPDSRYLAAVAIGASAFSTLYWGAGFLKAGTIGLAAQAYGQQDKMGSRIVLMQGLLLAVCIGLILVLMQYPMLIMVHRFFLPPPESVASVDIYFRIRIWGAPAALMSLVVMGWYVGSHNTRIPLVLSIVINVVNALLNVLFVVVLGYKTAGVALGTVMSEYLGLLLGVYFLVRHSPSWLTQCDWRAVCSWSSYSKLLGVNRDYFIRTLFLMFTFVFFTRQSALMGKDVLAANEILKQFLLIIALALDGYAHATEAIAGAAWSARNQVRFQSCIRIVVIWAGLTSIVLSLLFAVGGVPLLHWLTNLPQVLTLAQHYLWWVVLLPVVSVWSFILDGVFIGTTEAHYMRDTMILAVILFFLPVWFMTQGWGNHGLWLSMLSFYVARSIALGAVFYRRYWIRDWSVN